MDKGEMYQLMNQQLEGLLKATPYRISGLANASALLWAVSYTHLTLPTNSRV